MRYNIAIIAVDVVAWQADPQPVAPISNIGTCSCPSCSNSYLAPLLLLGEQGRMAQVFWFCTNAGEPEDGRLSLLLSVKFVFQIF